MPTTISAAQLAANRANSQMSTGPRTAEGKAKSSLNAVRTGLTGRTILLSASEADAYELHVARFASDWNPIGDREVELVQSLSDTQWRLNRIPILEAGLYASRRLDCADLFLDEADENVRTLLIENHIWETNRRLFNNLRLQESRLRRHYIKDVAELKDLQAKRREADQPAVRTALEQARPAPAASNGFEFAETQVASSEPARTDPPATKFSAPGVR